MIGHTADAAAIILSSYFAGLAVGYYAGSYWPEKLSPLLGAAFAEFGVAAWAMILPDLLREYVSLTHGNDNRLLLCFAAFLPGSAFLGATLPLTAKWLAGKEFVRRTVPRYYAFNTAGAFAGVLLTTFVLLLHVGVTKSGYLAAAVSAFCGLALIAVYVSKPKTSPAAALAQNRDSVKNNLADRLFWCCVSAIGGLGIMALEVLYTRLLSLVGQNSIYTFGACIATVLAALAVGAALAGWFGKWFVPQLTAALAATLGAASIAASVVLFVRLTKLQYLDFGQSFLAYLGMVSLLLLSTIFLPFCVLGMLLPVAWQSSLAASSESWRAVGRLSALNSLACAVGAYGASFLLVPAVGLWTSLAAVAATFYLLGLAALWRCQFKSLRLVGTVVLTGLIGCWLWLSLENELESTTEHLVWLDRRGACRRHRRFEGSAEFALPLRSYRRKCAAGASTSTSAAAAHCTSSPSQLATMNKKRKERRGPRGTQFCGAPECKPKPSRSYQDHRSA